MAKLSFIKDIAIDFIKDTIRTEVRDLVREEFRKHIARVGKDIDLLMEQSKPENDVPFHFVPNALNEEIHKSYVFGKQLAKIFLRHIG